MRLARQEAPPLQPEQDPTANAGNTRSLLTPARRAALDALEREFHDLLLRDAVKAATA